MPLLPLDILGRKLDKKINALGQEIESSIPSSDYRGLYKGGFFFCDLIRARQAQQPKLQQEKDQRNWGNQECRVKERLKNISKERNTTEFSQPEDGRTTFGTITARNVVETGSRHV